MSFFLIDADDNFLGDFGTSQGLIDLEKNVGTRSTLRTFLERGMSSEKEALITDCEKGADTKYIVPMIRSAKFPVMITDGVSED